MLLYEYTTHVLRQISTTGEASEQSFEDWAHFRHEFAHVVATWRDEAVPLATVVDGVEANRILAAAYNGSAGSSLA